MSAYDFSSPRLYVVHDLSRHQEITLDKEQSHYLLNVMRIKAGETVLLFNGRDGEWQGSVTLQGRKTVAVECLEQTREQTLLSQVCYAFAPLKQARLDYMVQKAVEMGAGHLQPVLTQHTQVSRLNMDRLRANMMEAAEQCGVLAVPTLHEAMTFSSYVARLSAQQLVIFCDEDAPQSDPILALQTGLKFFYDTVPDLKNKNLWNKTPQIIVVVGPEGGFHDLERTSLLNHPAVIRLSLGPYILRADTAAIASLALVQAVVRNYIFAS